MLISFERHKLKNGNIVNFNIIRKPYFLCIICMKIRKNFVQFHSQFIVSTEAAKEKAPAVIFIDEIDSVGAKRTNSALHPYANQTVNQLLTEMDG